MPYAAIIMAEVKPTQTLRNRNAAPAKKSPICIHPPNQMMISYFRYFQKIAAKPISSPSASACCKNAESCPCCPCGRRFARSAPPAVPNKKERQTMPIIRCSCLSVLRFCLFIAIPPDTRYGSSVLIMRFFLPAMQKAPQWSFRP